MGKYLPILPMASIVLGMGGAEDAIQTMREARGWTLAELARRARCDAGYLGRVERGERTASRYFLAHLAETLAAVEEDGAA